VALLAFLDCLLLRRRLRRAHPDVQVGDRTRLLLVIGTFLNLIFLAPITGSGIALLVLRHC
jgi:hypothetical protein